MLVRYKLTSTPTIADFKNDIDNIVTGTSTSVMDLCEEAQTYSSVVGNNTSTWTKVSSNSTTYTYERPNYFDNVISSFMRLTFDSTKLVSITLARDHIPETDTLVDSYVETVNIEPALYSTTYPTGIDFVSNSRMFFVQAVQSARVESGQFIGVFDISPTGITREFPDSMLTTMIKFNAAMSSNYSTQDILLATTNGYITPYNYNVDTLSYGTTTGGLLAFSPRKKRKANGDLMLTQNQVVVTSPQDGYTTQLVYSLYKLPTGSLSGLQTFVDPLLGGNHLSFLDFSILVD